jgi:hypothetical protein
MPRAASQGRVQAEVLVIGAAALSPIGKELGACRDLTDYLLVAKSSQEAPTTFFRHLTTQVPLSRRNTSESLAGSMHSSSRRLTSSMSCKQKWRSLCVCKGCDTFDCQLHAFVRRQRDSAPMPNPTSLPPITDTRKTVMASTMHRLAAPEIAAPQR